MASTRKRKRAGGIGPRVRRIREAKGLSAKRVWEAVGYANAADFCNFEMGRRNKEPRPGRLLALAKVLGVSVEELVG